MAKPDTTLPHLSPQRIKRFWNKVDIRGAEECWPWTGDTNKKNRYGYWHLYIDAKKRLFRVHRVAYFLSNGIDPVGFLVRHKCDNRPCCNPAHLLTGSHQDNMDDMTERKRTATGDKNGSRLYPERLKRGASHPGTLHPENLPRGEDHGMSKLTDEMVRDIRSRYRRYSRNANSIVLAKEYGVDKSLVNLVVRNKIWKHVV